MRAHILQHVPFEGPGSIASWLDGRRAAVTTTRAWTGDPLPTLAGLDLVVSMGGPMSVGDVDEYPWLASERRLLGEAVLAGVPVLGVCLGAQLLAAALGARVFPGPHKEIGWFPVIGESSTGTQTGETGETVAGRAVRLPERFDAFHWHGDTFDLPSGATLLASSEACRTQAFQLRRAVGLQFHLEITREGVGALVAACGDELVPGTYIQTAEQMLAAPPEAYARPNGVLSAVLDALMAPG